MILVRETGSQIVQGVSGQPGKAGSRGSSAVLLIIPREMKSARSFARRYEEAVTLLE